MKSPDIHYGIPMTTLYDYTKLGKLGDPVKIHNQIYIRMQDRQRKIDM